MEFTGFPDDMKVVTVSGAQKGVGKTALAEILLKNLPGFAAIKITMTDLYTSVSEDNEDIMIPDTDTFRMKKSGAEKVVWVKATEKLLQDAMEQALGKISNHKGVLIEGNSILEYINPTLAFFVVNSSIDNMKPSRIRALKKADICVINQKNGCTVSDETLKKIKFISPEIKIHSFDLLSANLKDNEDIKKLKMYLKNIFKYQSDTGVL
ncbi:MAG: hypothetical protein KAR43_12635 [Deltaproteobacteria bacterium]|nr:hypothetical protein [Deltaproteobacteria bacterium]